MSHNSSVGEKIKSLRENKQMSREELSQQSGLDIAQIAHIEDQSELPALALLVKIARALGVRLGTFLDDQEELGPVITRSGKQNGEISFTTHTTGDRKHMDYRSLARSKNNRHMEPFIIDIEPAQPTECELSSHEGEEFIYVMDGVVEISYGNTTCRLAAGDSIYYDSVVPHHVHAGDGQQARILAVVYIPV